MTVGRVRPLTGATHVFGMPHTARGRLGCARPSRPPVGSLPDQQSHAGRPQARRNGLVPSACLTMADRPTASEVGERVIRRLEAALNGLPARMIRGGATPEGSGDERVKTRTAPRPKRAPVPVGSLPSTPQAAPVSRPPARRSRKTLPRQRINRTGGAHRRSAKMCIDPRCLLHTSGTAQHIRNPTRFEPPPADPSSMFRRVPSSPGPRAFAPASQGRRRASWRPAKPPYSSRTQTSPPRMACSMRVPSRRNLLVDFDNGRRSRARSWQERSLVARLEGNLPPQRYRASPVTITGLFLFGRESDLPILDTVPIFKVRA